MKTLTLLMILFGTLSLTGQTPTQKRDSTRRARIQQALNKSALTVNRLNEARKERIWKRIRLYQLPSPPSFRKSKPLTPATVTPRIPSGAEHERLTMSPIGNYKMYEETDNLLLGMTRKKLQLQFFGRELSLAIDPALGRINLNNTTATNINKIWYALSLCEYQSLLNQLSKHSQEFFLNDWGYIQLTHQVAGKCLSAGYSPQVHRLLTTFLLKQSGYEVGLAKEVSSPQLLTIIASPDLLYRQAALIAEDLPHGRNADWHYYVIYPENGRIFTQVTKKERWQCWFPMGETAPHAMDLTISQPPLLDDKNWLGHAPEFVSREFDFPYQGKQVKLSWRISKNLVAFYETYPVTELSKTFAISLGQSTLHFQTSHAPNSLLAGYNTAEGLGLLLACCQRLPRKKDVGEAEEYFFPEESLMKGYTDCDDRVILLAALVRCYLKLDVQLVSWIPPSEKPAAFEPHVAICVKLSTDNWIYCDPTCEAELTSKPLNPGQLAYPYCHIKPSILAQTDGMCNK